MKVLGYFKFHYFGQDKEQEEIEDYDMEYEPIEFEPEDDEEELQPIEPVVTVPVPGGTTPSPVSLS